MINPTLRIAGREIGPHTRTYLIAEMSGNHNQLLERALQIVDAAANAGADAIKLQTYTADTMTLNIRAPGFVIDDPKSLWAGRQLYELYAEAATPWEWHAPLMRRARSHGMHCFSTPFDHSAVDFLETLEVPAYKIASFECGDLALIRKVAATGKPIIISTGMASLNQIGDAVRCAREAGCTQLVLLKCTSSYPASPVNTHIRTLPALREEFGALVGLSDHTLGCGVALASVALGACVIEKHFTLSRSEGGVDSAFSLEPAEFAQLRIESERAWQGLGEIRFGATESEHASQQFRRSLYIVKAVRAGEVLSADNVRAIRPGFGLEPIHLDEVLGCRLAANAPAGTPLSWELLEA